MNVLFDCERMKYPYTGLFEYCIQLGKALQSTITGDDELAYYIPSQYKGYFGNSKYYIYSPLHKFFPLAVKQAAIWHTNSHYRFIKANPQMKRLLTVHDLNFLYEKTSPSKINKYLNLFQDNINRADSIVAISEYTKQDILTHLDIKGKQISVIHNGCNVLEYPDFNNPKYVPLNPFLFTIGTVLPKKNFHVLPCLLKDNDFELIIAGKGSNDYSQKIMDEAKRFGVEGRVKLIGAVTPEDKYWYLKSCTAFLFPSLAEGFGIPPIEAMHFGKPVFLSTATSLPEIGGQYAYYFNTFDPDDMMNVFEKGMENYQQSDLKEAIICHANRFNWGDSAKAYWQVYKSLL